MSGRNAPAPPGGRMFAVGPAIDPTIFLGAIYFGERSL